MKKRVEDAEKTYNAKIADMEFGDALSKELESIKFSSNSARKAVEERVKSAGLKLSGGKILGFNDLIEQIKAEDGGAFVTDAQENKAKFTQKKNGQP